MINTLKTSNNNEGDQCFITYGTNGVPMIGSYSKIAWDKRKYGHCNVPGGSDYRLLQQR